MLEIAGGILAALAACIGLVLLVANFRAFLVLGSVAFLVVILAAQLGG